MSRADLLAEALDRFVGISPEVEAAAIVSADGLPLASALPEHVEEDRLAAMSAALLILGERAASGLGKGDLSEVMVEGGDGYVVLMAAGPHAVLVAVTSTAARAGLLLFEMRKIATQVASVMPEDPGAVEGAPLRAEEQAQEPRQPAPRPQAPRPSGAESSIPNWR